MTTFSQAMHALAGRADSADLNAWMTRRFAIACLAFDEARSQRGSRISCGGKQMRDAYHECLGAALVAWEAFDGMHDTLEVYSAPIDSATVQRLRKFQGRGG